MSHVRKGMLARCGEWAKHLRPFGKRIFWHKHRKYENRLARREASDQTKEK